MVGNRCPRCAGPLSGAAACAACGLQAPDGVTSRLWLLPEAPPPPGFDAAAAQRLSDMVQDGHFWLRERRRLAGRCLQLLAAARTQPWRAAVELGCGAGSMLSLLEEAASDVVALDGHRTLLEQARTRSRRATLLQGDVTATGLPAARFDLVAAFDVLEHVDPDAFLAEARRLAAPGADLLLSVPAFGALWSDLDAQAGHRCRYRWRMLRAELERQGWSPAGHTHFQCLLFPLVWALRRLPGRVRRVERRPLPVIDRLLGGVNRLEVELFGDISLPFGSSLLAWAKAT